MDFNNYLNQARVEIDSELERIFKAWRSRTGDFNVKLEPFVEEAIEATVGGKRLRGALVKLGFDLAQNHLHTRGVSKIIEVAAAVEIFQTALLIHDDIIDQSTTRRGRATTYRKLGGDHHGQSLALILGDAGFFLGFNLLLKSNFPPPIKERALKRFNDSLSYTCLGQILDIEVPRAKVLLEKDLFDIFYLKTAHYSLIGPLQLGASLAGADDNLLTLLEEFGKDLGVAFQLQDDILGIFGEEKSLGKSVSSDVEEGKATLLLSYAMDKANQAQKKVLAHYGRGKLTKIQLEAIRRVFVETGALSYAKETAFFFTDKAKRLIKKVTGDTKMQVLLTEMSDFLISRSK